MAPYSGPTRSPLSTNDHAEPAFGRAGGQASRRASMLGSAQADLERLETPRPELARATGRTQPRLAETRGPSLEAVPRRLELRAGERATVSSSEDGEGGSGMLRTVAFVALGVLALVGVVAVLHMMGLHIPF